ncbi:28822_t:CDS:2, partial [Gigaspora margarita]
TMQIFVKTLTDETLEFDALLSDTIKELKEKIHARNNYSFHSISFKGNKLDDNKLDALPSDTVKELKEKIHAKTNCSFHGISFKGNKLDNSSRLFDIGTENGCTFYCCIQIFVRTTTDETLELDALPSDTVKELKEKIHARNNCSFHSISFKGNKLDDNSRLSDIGTENGCTFYCCIQIFVRTTTDETLELDVLPSDTVKELKEKIHARSNCSFIALVLKIFVKTPTDETLELDALPSDTVMELKQIIHVRNNCSFHGISFKGNKLNDSSRLSDIGMENGCTFYCYIQIFVKTPTDETLELDALPSDTVKELKEKIHARNNCSFHSISFKGNKLDYGSRLSDIGTENGCTFYCCIQIFVRTTTDETLELDALPSDTVEELKEKIHTRSNCSFHDISFKGNKLYDILKLSTLGIENGCTLHCCSQIFIKTPTNGTVELDVLLSNTVMELKQKIQARVSSSINRISFEGNELVDNCRLSDAGIKNGCTIYCFIQIFLKFLNGKIFTFQVSRTDTVGHVKRLIENSEHIPSDQQSLVYAGKYLEDHHKLSDCKIQDGTTVHVVIRLHA